MLIIQSFKKVCYVDKLLHVLCDNNDNIVSRLSMKKIKSMFDLSMMFQIDDTSVMRWPLKGRVSIESSALPAGKLNVSRIQLMFHPIFNRQCVLAMATFIIKHKTG